MIFRSLLCSNNFQAWVEEAAVKGTRTRYEKNVEHQNKETQQQKILILAVGRWRSLYTGLDSIVSPWPGWPR
jgi:hypothetical protein